MFLICLVVAVFSPSVLRADVGGVWKAHPGADLVNLRPAGQLVESFRGERFSYFVNRGQDLSRKASPYDIEHNAIFRYDSEFPEKQIYPLSDDVDFCGINIEEAAYSQEYKCLLIVNVDKSIDLVFDSGDHVRNSTLQGICAPGIRNVLGITFDISAPRAYIGLGNGYMILDLKSGECVEYHNIETAVSYVTRVGDRMVFVANPNDDRGLQVVSPQYGYLYITDIDDQPTVSVETAMAVTPVGTVPSLVTADYVVNQAQYLQPLDDDSFVVAGFTNDNTRISVAVGKINVDGSVSMIEVWRGSTDPAASGSTDRQYHNFLIDGYAGEYRDGFVFNFSNGILLVKSGICFDAASESAADDFRNAACILLPKAGNASSLPVYESNEHFRKVSTYDGVNFWFYRPTKGNVNRSFTVSDDSTWEVKGTWSVPDEMLTYNAPLTGRPYTLAYNPKYGMMVRGCPQMTFMNKSVSNSYQFDNLSYCRHGRWEPFSLKLKEVTNGKNSNFLRQNAGIAVDPFNPDFVYSSHFYYGMQRFNLADPEDMLLLGKTTDNFSYPGFIPVLEPQEAWKSVGYFPAIRFDADGNMYAFKTDLTGRFVYYYWSAEDRMAAADAVADKDLYAAHPMIPVSVCDWTGLYWADLIVFQEESNKGILVVDERSYISPGRCPIIVDTRGTPTDPDDDMVWRMDDLSDFETKYQYESGASCGVAEIPERKSLWIFTNFGIFEVFPEELRCGELYMHRVDFIGADGNVMTDMFADGLASDALGRKWLATRASGLYCVNIATMSIEAVMNTENSPLPSNEINDVEYDPSDGSIWVATEAGLMQFFPEGTPGYSALGGSVRVFPSEVTDSYCGYVTICGLTDGVAYKLVDADGSIISQLPASVGGRIQWHPQSGARGAYIGAVYVVKADSDPTAAPNRLAELLILK